MIVEYIPHDHVGFDVAERHLRLAYYRWLIDRGAELATLRLVEAC